MRWKRYDEFMHFRDRTTEGGRSKRSEGYVYSWSRQPRNYDFLMLIGEIGNDQPACLPFRNVKRFDEQGRRRSHWIHCCASKAGQIGENVIQRKDCAGNGRKVRW